MNKRLYYLADGTLLTVTAGRFRGDDEIATKTVTQQIVVRDDGVNAAGAAVHMDPGNPEGPLVVHYDSAAGQAGLSVVDDHTMEEVFEINNVGKVRALRGLETTTLDASTAV